MSDITHTKVREERTTGNTTRIITKSYNKELENIRTEISKNIQTSNETLLKDVVSCLEKLRETETELTIRITKRFGKPVLIVQTWTISKEYYGK